MLGIFCNKSKLADYALVKGFLRMSSGFCDISSPNGAAVFHIPFDILGFQLFLSMPTGKQFFTNCSRSHHFSVSRKQQAVFCFGRCPNPTSWKAVLNFAFQERWRKIDLIARYPVTIQCFKNTLIIKELKGVVRTFVS